LKRALVTGGAGFIGSHLVERLLGAGYEVRVLDDFSTGRRENLAAAVASGAPLTITAGDVTDLDLTVRAAEGVDEVYHLAAAVGVTLIVAQPIRTLETNIRGTEAALEAAARAGARFFLASSSEVYGKSERVPFDEDDDLLIGSSRFARWGYACSKAVDEFLAMAFVRERGLRATVGRLFNTIGPRQVGTYGMVVPRFVEAALAGRPLEVYGSGRQTRTFCDVRDTVEAIHRATLATDSGGQVFNIGGDHEIAIADLADRVLAVTHSSAGKRLVSYETAYGEAIDDMPRRWPRLDRLRRLLGQDWPHYKLEDTLETIIADRKRV
jgi:UDP-glucose 4-epimerase